MTEPYVPQLGIVYPEKPDERMVKFKILRDIKLDADYPFLDKSFKFSFVRNIMYLGIFTLVFFLNPLRHGLKIEGRSNLRKHKKLLKNGAITICNHVNRWDFLFVLQAVRYRSMYFPVWKEQLRSKDMGFIRHAGGIPVPEEISIIKYFNRAFDEICEKKKWIHVFPESSRWDYFCPIRPFKKGAFTMAHRYNLPIIPLAISYRKPRFSFQKLPRITIRIGEPIFFDANLPRKEAVAKLRKDCHEEVVRLAGLRSNPYPAEGD